MKMWSKSVAALAAVVLVLGFMAPAGASHSWGNYHWARTSSSFDLGLGDNVDGTWGSYLDAASIDWSKSDVLDTTVVPGATNGRKCRPSTGFVEVCNASYGNTGWLGVAQIWASGSHITQGTVKLNDTYFNTSTYDSPAWRQMVMCQEIGHTFGLDHQDEDFSNANLDTCMDYTSDPTSNTQPNAHDYEQLASIYSHLDGMTTVGDVQSRLGGGDGGGTTGGGKGGGKGKGPNKGASNAQSDWGRAIAYDASGQPSVFQATVDGQVVITHVTWAN